MSQTRILPMYPPTDRIGDDQKRERWSSQVNQVVWSQNYPQRRKPILTNYWIEDELKNRGLVGDSTPPAVASQILEERRSLTDGERLIMRRLTEVENDNSQLKTMYNQVSNGLMTLRGWFDGSTKERPRNAASQRLDRIRRELDALTSEYRARHPDYTGLERVSSPESPYSRALHHLRRPDSQVHRGVRGMNKEVDALMATCKSCEHQDILVDWTYVQRLFFLAVYTLVVLVILLNLGFELDFID
ncbi:hypothetical protein JX266_011016 [Neoarthrinium moseri]|nr:hypothetical protein JX266_011016 [Neoarthrinium moseri]